MKALLLLFSFIYYEVLQAQNTTTITIKAGSSIWDALTTNDIFQYSQFTIGKVSFKDGINAEAKMNYNRLLDEMHFIDAKGDTLALANEKIIRFIVIDKDSFFYDHGYVRRISGNNVVKLALKQVFRVADKKKAGAYNTTSSISSIASKNTFFDGRRYHKLTVNEDMVLSRDEQYFFGDKYNHFVLANKKNLLSLFPKEQRRIEMYLKDNKVDFDKKEDLDKIVMFLEQL